MQERWNLESVFGSWHRRRGYVIPIFNSSSHRRHPCVSLHELAETSSRQLLAPGPLLPGREEFESNASQMLSASMSWPILKAPFHAMTKLAGEKVREYFDISDRRGSMGFQPRRKSEQFTYTSISSVRLPKSSIL